MNLKIAICDDSEPDIGFLSDLLSRWASAREITLQTESFSSAEAFLFRYAEDKAYDILLLDIEMENMDGVTMARQIRKENDAIPIIFITGYSAYIAEGYEVAALHYLMKPVKEEKLFAVLDRAIEKILLNERYLNLTLSGEMIRIPLREIYYLDVHQNYVTVHGKKDYTVKRTLGEFERLLDERFFRVGRAALVNLNCIGKVTRTDIFLLDGTRLPLPRGAYESLNRAIIAHT